MVDPKNGNLLLRLADEVVRVQEFQCLGGAEDATVQPISLF
jgi:hypothetical protein